MMYVDILRARLEHLCAEFGIPMPSLITQLSSKEPVVKPDHIICSALPAKCPADHKVRAWEIARIWWGVSMIGRPFAQQQAMAAVDIILE
jgi:transcriptional regulator with XRE-family HTH domain